jgi:hypothetical protein
VMLQPFSKNSKCSTPLPKCYKWHVKCNNSNAVTRQTLLLHLQGNCSVMLRISSEWDSTLPKFCWDISKLQRGPSAYWTQ